MKILQLTLLLFVFSIDKGTSQSPYLVVLGTVQDAGSPHMGCDKLCCKSLFDNPDPKRMVVSLGIVDPKSKETWMIEATPNFPLQCKLLLKSLDFEHGETPDGIFLTHAHIGHYTGLMYLGRESMNASKVPIYAMTRMKGFLIQNGPWSQLFKIENIKITNIDHQQKVQLSEQIAIEPFLVPHRDEFSETVGYKIQGPNKTILFIPDIDKWSKWNQDVIKEIMSSDLALIDGTFYDAEEVNYRNMEEIPHPFIVETMELFKEENSNVKLKVGFIHLNHTNPLLDTNSQQYQKVINEGFNVMRFNQKIDL